jgi:hypothetical protein
MPNTVRIKRRVSGAQGAPASLSNAELAFNEMDNTLYYGFGDNGSGGSTSVQAIGGNGSFVDKVTTQTITGSKTFSATVLCSATIPPNDNSTTLATTSWVLTKIGSISSGVTTFNGRSGAVTFLSSDITGALGYTPVNYSLPTASSSVLGGVKIGTGITVSGDGTISANVTGGGVTSFNTRTGAITLVAGDVTPITDPIYLKPATADATYLKLTGGTVSGALIVSGDLTVNGTTTTVNAQNLDVTDKNITLGKVATPTDATANGGGITLKGATDKTIVWDQPTGNWLLSESVDVASSKSYKVAGTTVLDATTLGVGVVNSSLTKVGTLTSGTWNAGVISVAYGGTGVNTITGIIKGNSQAAFSAAVAGTDYLAPSSIIDGGTF